MTTDDFDQLNEIAHYRNRLDDIRDWYLALPDIMLTISSYSPDLTGTKGTTNRLPGGDALAMRAPWSADADHGDDLPHPAQICHEWVNTLNGVPLRTFTQNWRWLRDHAPQILGSPYASAWREDIDALWHRLELLIGDAPRTETRQRGPLDCQARAHEIPDTQRLTLAEASVFWPKIRSRVDVDRHRERDQARKENRAPAYRCNPDHRGRYLVADLRNHYGARRDEQEHARGMTSV